MIGLNRFFHQIILYKLCVYTTLQKCSYLEIKLRYGLVISVRCDLLRHQFTVAAAARIVVGPVLVSHLTARFAAPELATLDEAGIPVDANDSIVQPRPVHVAHRVLRVAALIVLDEAKAARRLLVLVQAHYDAPNVAASREQLVDLFLGGVERQIAHIECSGEPQ